MGLPNGGRHASAATTVPELGAIHRDRGDQLLGTRDLVLDVVGLVGVRGLRDSLQRVEVDEEGGRADHDCLLVLYYWFNLE